MNWKAYLCGSASVLAMALVALPASAQSDTADSDNLETVVVTGIRASLEKGLEVKRQATQVVESIAAEDIGKFPDNNVVEALQRISGVQVTDREGAETSTIAIRGMSDIETTWNGRKLFTSDARYFSVQDMPATLVSRLDTYKTRGANMIESGIGGVIDVKTHHPFDFDGFKFSMQYRETYEEKAGSFNPNFSMMVSDTWNTGIGKIGVLANFSYVTNRYRTEFGGPGAMVPFASSDVYDSEGNLLLYAGRRVYPSYAGTVSSTALLSTYTPSYITADSSGSNVSVQKTLWTPGMIKGLDESSGATMTGSEYVSHGSSTTTGNSITIPYVLSRDAVFLTDNTGKTTRPNMNIAFQWQPSENALYTFEFMYNGYRNVNEDNMLFTYVDWWGEYDPSGTAASFTDDISLYDGTNVVKSRTARNVYGFNSGDYAMGKTNSFVYAAHALWTVNDRLTLDADASYQHSKYHYAFFAARIHRTVDSVYVDYNETAGSLSIVFDDEDTAGLTDPSAWTTGELYDDASYTKGDAYTVTLDGVYDTSDMAGPLKKVSFGVRLDDRGAQAGERNATTTQVYYNLAEIAEEVPGIVTKNHNFFKGISNVPRSWVNIDPTTLYKHRKYFRSLFGGQLTSDIYETMFDDFDIDEINTAAYLMVDLEKDVFGSPLKLNAGLRWVEIKDTTKFWDYDTYVASTTLGEVDEDGDSGSTHAFLPSLTLTYSPLDSLMFRFSFGKTLRNPDFDDLNPTRTLASDVTNIGYGTGSQGNATLKPTESTNYDLTAEWYFAPNSALYTTFFRRDIKNLVVTLNKSLKIEGDDIEALYNTNNFIVTTPINASKGWLKGIEVGLVYFPEQLPWWLDGVGFQGSMTFLGSRQNVPESDDLGNITNQLSQPFYGISSVSYNSTLIYEHGGFSTRVSYVWRSHFHYTDEAASFGNPLGVWRRAESEMDISAGYDLGHGVSFTFDATNLLNAKQKKYYFNDGVGDKNQTDFGTTLIERTFSLGFRFSTD